MGISYSQGEIYQLNYKNLGDFLVLPFFFPPIFVYAPFEMIWKQIAADEQRLKINIGH